MWSVAPNSVMSDTRPEIFTTLEYGFVGSNTAIATRASFFILWVFSLPVAVLTRMFFPSVSTHTGDIFGEPVSIKVTN